MAWVFANWWQVLIVVWFGGVLSELTSAVVKSRLSWHGEMPLAHKIGLWLGPFIWPFSLLFVGLLRRSDRGAVITVGEYGYEIRRGLDAHRLLEDLTVEFPIEGVRKHVLMLGEKEGEVRVLLQRANGKFESLLLTREDQNREHDVLVDGICDFVDRLDAEREKSTKQDLQ